MTPDTSTTVIEDSATEARRAAWGSPGREPWMMGAATVILATALLSSCGAAASDPPTTVPSLEFLSEFTIGPGTRFEGACVGGLSALEYDRGNDRFLAISDSRRDARFFTLDVDLGTDDEGEPVIASVVLESVTKLTTREGEPYPDGRVDPEGLVLIADGEAYISSEGDAAQSVPPFVDRINVSDGSFLQSVTIPRIFRPRHDGDRQTHGVRPNLGFESLALSSDRQHLYVASESSLAQDTPEGEAVPAGTRLYSRVLHYLVGEVPSLQTQVLYPLDQPEGEIVVHGLVELQTLADKGRLLAMERTFGYEVGMIIRIYEVDFGRFVDDTDRSSLGPEAAGLPVLDKRLVLDLAEIPATLDNFESLTFGPQLPDGSTSFWIIGDNDNVDCEPTLNPVLMRPTKLLLFRWRD